MTDAAHHEAPGTDEGQVAPVIALPATMPEGWVRQLAQAMPQLRPTGTDEGRVSAVIALPATMPKKRIKQLARAMPGSLPTLLGSAVLAAVIGWASSYFTARMTISANVHLEETKLNLQLAQEQARARSAAYTNLAGTLNDLHNAFASYLVLVEVASAHGMIAADEEALSAQFSEVGKAEAKVAAANRNPILAPAALTTDVDSCLSQLIPALVQASRDPRSILVHKEIDAKMIELTSRAQQAANSQSMQSH